MKLFITAAILLLTATAANADGISCPEMAKMIKDYENEKKSGHMTKVHAETVNGILSATRKSYDSAGCNAQTEKQVRK